MKNNLKSLKLHWKLTRVKMLFNNYEEEVEKIIAIANQIVAEADQMAPEADNEENVNIEIVNEKFDESIDDISFVAFAESDEEEVKEEKIKWLL